MIFLEFEILFKFNNIYKKLFRYLFAIIELKYKY